jgi:hypothetical protein
MSDSPFIVGARVAMRSHDGEIWREHFVEKVYKNGNFTLRGDKQQWRAICARWGDDNVSWDAWRTGDHGHWDRTTLNLWGESTEAHNRAVARRSRYYALRKRFERVHERDLTDAMLDAVEGVLPPLAPPATKGTE